jgi:hypothetical protein
VSPTTNDSNKDEELFQAVKLQSWFWDRKERYRVIDESQQVVQDRQARRAAIRDASEESNNPEANNASSSSNSGCESSQDEVTIKSSRRLRIGKPKPMNSD